MSDMTPLPEALKRVTTSFGRDIQQAALIKVDYSNGKDTAHVVINPDIAPPESYDGYRIQAAVMAALEGFKRYHRAVTRTLGIRPEHEQLFEKAEHKALFEVQQLIHLTPGQGASAAALSAAEVKEPEPQPLPDSFPFVAWLRADGLTTDLDLAGKTPEELTAAYGQTVADQMIEGASKLLPPPSAAAPADQLAPQPVTGGEVAPAAPKPSRRSKGKV